MTKSKFQANIKRYLESHLVSSSIKAAVTHLIGALSHSVKGKCEQNVSGSTVFCAST